MICGRMKIMSRCAGRPGRWSTRLVEQGILSRKGGLAATRSTFTDEAREQNGRGVQRTELIIFIRPQIIRDSVDANTWREQLAHKLTGQPRTARRGRPVPGPAAPTAR